jgi:hypothetical protein
MVHAPEEFSPSGQLAREPDHPDEQGADSQLPFSFTAI